MRRDGKTLTLGFYRQTILADEHGYRVHPVKQIGLRCCLAFAAILLFLLPASAQDWIKTGTGLGVEKIRLAVPDFKASNADARNADLLNVFNDTLWNDLDNAGIFDMVSKSFYPIGPVGTPADVKFEAWNVPPPNASMLAFGNLGATGDSLTVQGWLYDIKNITSPQVLGKQYTDAATADAARKTAQPRLVNVRARVNNRRMAMLMIGASRQGPLEG